MSYYNSYILEAITTVVKKMGYNFDVTKRGLITEVLSGNRYKVKVYDKTYTIKSNFSYNVGERVFVLFPQGQDTEDKYLYPNR